MNGHDLTNAQGKPLEVVFGWQKPVAGYDFQLTDLGWQSTCSERVCLAVGLFIYSCHNKEVLLKLTHLLTAHGNSKRVSPGWPDVAVMSQRATATSCIAFVSVAVSRAGPALVQRCP